MMWQRSGTDAESAPPIIGELARLAEATSDGARLPAAGQPLTGVHARMVVPPRTTLATPLRSAGVVPVRPAAPAQRLAPRRGR